MKPTICDINPVLLEHCLWVFYPRLRPFQSFTYRGDYYIFVHLRDNPYLSQRDRTELLN